MTRRAREVLPKGRSHVRFEIIEGKLDEDMELEITDGITASSSKGASVLSIELVNSIRRVTPERLEQTSRDVEKLETELTTANRLLQNASADLAILEVFGRRIVEDSGMVAGSTNLNLEELDKQLEFISDKRMTILQAREAAEASATELELASRNMKARLEREKRGVFVVNVELEVESPEGGEVDIELTWFSHEARWEPEFTIRTTQENPSASVELNAMIQNATGNDWTDAQLALSTATADPLNAPATVTPVTIDVVPDVYSGDAALPQPSTSYFGSPMITNLGPATIYTLAEKITLPHASSKRLLVERFETSCKFTAIARPVTIPGVWSRGTIRNAPELLLLPGPADLFIDGSFLGQTDLTGEVAPGEDFDVWYGELPGIDVERTILERETVKTGLLGGGRLTRTHYRIAIRNGSTKPVDLIVEDRMPVSRSGEIEVSLKNISPALSTDAAYVKEERPLGILRWDMSLPAGGPDAQPVFIEWTVNVSRSSDIKTTPIPE